MKVKTAAYYSVTSSRTMSAPPLVFGGCRCGSNDDRYVLTKSSKPRSVPLNSTKQSVSGQDCVNVAQNHTFVALHNHPYWRANAAIDELEREQLRGHVLSIVSRRRSCGDCPGRRFHVVTGADEEAVAASGFHVR